MREGRPLSAMSLKRRAPLRDVVSSIIVSLTWKGGDRLPRLPEEIRKQAPLFLSLVRVEPVLISSVRLALRRSATRTVEAAHGPAPHRGSLAPLARALRGCRAPRSVLEGILAFHEDGSRFSKEPRSPGRTTLPPAPNRRNPHAAR